MTVGDDPRRSDTATASTNSVTFVETKLDCRIEEYDDRAECTLFPADVSEDDLVTTWVTAANDDAFVDLETVR
ncbi:DUF7511 domain-containing protein [Halobacterium zhouii]|uniref:DUF7511 domain-containing protein n=1 Tax=Halobacterium zhouii TaxID=2902624 RepID=UPI001E4150BE|nr:hypothetical protein [Halobacterium zhouii]